RADAAARARLAEARAQQDAETREFTEREGRRLAAELQAAIDRELSALRQDFVAKSEGRQAELGELAAGVRAAEAVLGETRQYFNANLQVHQLSAAALALGKRLETSEPVGAELKLLREAAQGDPLVATAVAALGGEGKKGVPTAAQLKARFAGVHEAARRAALVPEGAGGAPGASCWPLLAP
ncbi:unnamed protein product, partial [Heterosigma akashiwo]